MRTISSRLFQKIQKEGLRPCRTHRVSRRHFFYGALLAGAVPAGGFGAVASLRSLGYKSPNEKLNIAAIGAGGRAAANINGCASENIVALADPDSKRAEGTFKRYENTKDALM